MKKKLYQIVTALLLGSAFFIHAAATAQTYELGGFAGLALYKGDISPIPNPLNPGGSFTAMGRYNIDHYSTIRLNLSRGFITGSDANNNQTIAPRRNTAFQSSIGEISFVYEHNFFPYRKDKERIRTTPYLFGGIGVMGYNTTGGREESSGSNPVIIPFGGGTKTMLTKNWNLNVEFGTRKTFTDFLDNTHDSVNNTQNGFRNTLDWYSFFQIGITYTFYTVKCPQ